MRSQISSAETSLLQPSRSQQALLSLLAPRYPTSRHDGELSRRDWESTGRQVQRHRLGPLLHWRVAHGASDLHAPQPFLDSLADSFHHHTTRAIQLQYAIARTHRLLHDRGIEAVFLKGAYLAFHVYPHPALRPITDVDVLVHENRAAEARVVLARNQLQVEVHSRLAPLEPAAPTRFDPAHDPALWRRLIRREMLDEQVTFLSPTDQLLHLVIHAIFDSHFRNGPLVLHDIAALVRQAEIDWPTFWGMAAAGGWLRGCELLLVVADRYCGPLSLSSPRFGQLAQLPEDFVAATTLLMLQEPATPPHLGWHANWAELTDWWRSLATRIPDYLASRDERRNACQDASFANLTYWLAQ
jgi:hypothetical protein